MLKRNVAILALTLSFFAAGSSLAAEFAIDTVHSTILFNVKHMGVGVAYGRFNQFEGTINYDAANPSSASFDVTINAESIDTGNEKRDGHLKNTDFFNAVEFPKVTFKSTAVVAEGKTLKVSGDLTILGVTKPVTIEMSDLGQADARGKILQGWHGTGTIKRSDFNMNYGIDNGALADEVNLIFSLESKTK